MHLCYFWVLVCVFCKSGYLGYHRVSCLISCLLLTSES